MNLCFKNEFRRCRPLLGTFVEIAVGHDDRREANAAIEAAFAAIDRVQRLMSFHDPASEVSKLNRLAASRSVRVSEETYKVLKEAKRLYDCTGGIFDITVASRLMDSGLLPKHVFLKYDDYCGTTAHIRLLPDGWVRFLRPLCIDLGGIAKGFAVDESISVLQAKGVPNGFINAGGDMRCFGDEASSIWVRHPKNSRQLLTLLTLKNAALATSANSYQRQGGVQPCAHIHGQTREPLPRPFSVSVRADSCLIADSLTKVVFALEAESVSVLNEFEATAFVVYPDNRVMRYPPASGQVRGEFP